MKNNLRKEIIKIKIQNKPMILAFDMASISTFTDMTGKGVLKSLPLLSAYDDNTVIAFLASTLRYENKPNEPIGKDIYKFDLWNLMIQLTPYVILIVTKGFPTGGNKKSKKK